MIEKLQRAGSKTGKQSGKQRTHRLKSVAALLGKLSCLEQQPATDVE